MNGFDQTLRIHADDHSFAARLHLVFLGLTGGLVSLAVLPGWGQATLSILVIAAFLSLLRERRLHTGIFAYRGVVLDSRDQWSVMEKTGEQIDATDREARLVRYLNWPFVIVLWLETERGNGSLWLQPRSVADSDWRRLRARLRFL